MPSFVGAEYVVYTVALICKEKRLEAFKTYTDCQNKMASLIWVCAHASGKRCTYRYVSAKSTRLM